MTSPRFTFRDVKSSPARSKQGTGSTPSKRRKFHSLFDDEEICCNSQLTSFLDSVKSSFPLKNVKEISTENLLSALVVRYSLPVVSRFLGALKHVPTTFDNRMTYIDNIVNFDKKHITTDEIDILAESLQSYADENNFSVDSDILWQCTRTHNAGYLTFLVPPVTACIVCGGCLYSFNKADITLFTMEGPKPGLKVTKRCKKGCLATYNIDRYFVPGDGTFFYTTAQPVISASNCVYMTRDVHELMCESANHGFVSHHAFSEIYNSLFSKCQQTEQFQHWLHSKNENHTDEMNAADLLEVSTEDLLDKQDEEPQYRHLMSRKKAVNCYLNGELVNEVQEREDKTLKIGIGESRESLMKHLDETRRMELYEHRQCGKLCKEKGCGTLRVIDSCWKVCMPHCMFAEEMEVEGLPLVNFPNVCTNEPKPNSVFCTHHHKMLEVNGIPTKKEEFLLHIGCKERPVSNEEIANVDKSTVKLSRELKKRSDQTTVSSNSSIYQGTTELLTQFSPDYWNSDVKCNKDTGQKSILRQRSRGHFVCVTGGGHIQYFEPIFKSESPGQIFLIVLRVMTLELSKVPEEQLEDAIQNFVLSYDNMCQLDALKAAKEPLPFPAPFDLMWQKIVKVIDRLHIKNHKDEKCQQIYNPSLIPDKYNTMIAEQTFSWFSRFKKIVNSMSSIRIENGGYEVQTRKGWENRTNFTLTLTGEVQHPSDTMYIARVEREDGISSVGSFALSDIYKSRDFATALNKSTVDGGHICQLNNSDLVLLVKALIKKMKEDNPIYRKELVKVAGLQEGTSTMVINPKEVICLSQGELKSIDETSFIWMGKSSPRTEMERNFLQPTTLKPLSDFFGMALTVLGSRTFGVAALAWAAMYGLNLYDWVIRKLRHFNLPVLFGEPMVGKTLIASCAAWMNGCPRTAIASRCTLPYVTVQVTSSSMPFVWDDPTTSEEVSQLAVDLGNAAVRGKLTEETRTPRTGCLVTANFDMSEMLKYFSRIVLLFVPKTSRKKQSGDATALESQAHKASAAFPLVMKELRNLEATDISDECARIDSKLAVDIRIVEGIAFNVLLVRKILNLAGRYDLMQHVLKYIESDLLPYYRRHLFGQVRNVTVEVASGFLPESAVDFQNADVNNTVVIKNGCVLAVDQKLIKDRETCMAHNGKSNKTTKVRGQSRKMFHLPTGKVAPHILQDLLRRLTMATVPRPTRTDDSDEERDSDLCVHDRTDETSDSVVSTDIVGNDVIADNTKADNLEPKDRETQENTYVKEIQQRGSKRKVISCLEQLNPKKSTKVLCNICRKEGRTGQKWICCDKCNFWMHKSCCRIDDKTFKRIEEKDLEWCCRDCK